MRDLCIIVRIRDFESCDYGCIRNICINPPLHRPTPALPLAAFFIMTKNFDNGVSGIIGTRETS